MIEWREVRKSVGIDGAETGKIKEREGSERGEGAVESKGGKTEETERGERTEGPTRARRVSRKPL